MICEYWRGVVALAILAASKGVKRDRNLLISINTSSLGRGVVGDA
jgi:hypothetical protein